MKSLWMTNRSWHTLIYWLARQLTSSWIPFAWPIIRITTSKPQILQPLPCGLPTGRLIASFFMPDSRFIHEKEGWPCNRESLSEAWILRHYRRSSETVSRWKSSGNCHPQPRQSFPLLRLVLWTFHNLYLIVGAAIMENPVRKSSSRSKVHNFHS